MEDVINNKPNHIKILVYSGHDIMIAPMELYLRKVFGTPLIYPHYTSNLNLKLLTQIICSLTPQCHIAYPGLARDAGPEVAESGRALARLVDVAGVDGQGLEAGAALEELPGHPQVERHRVHAAFLEVAAVGLLVGRAERAQLCEIGFLHHNKKNYRFNEQRLEFFS